MTTRNIELIVFDLDGTLVDTRRDLAKAVNFALKRVGLPARSEAEIISYVGRGEEHSIRKALGERQDLFGGAAPAFKEYYREHCADNSCLYPQVKEVLEYFGDKLRVVVSNKSHEFSVAILKAVGIYDHFQDVMGGDDPECRKPSSCPLDRIRERLEVDKGKSVIVGDMDIDIVAGKSAGILTCAVTYGLGKKEDLRKAGPDWMIDNIARLQDIIS